MNSLIMKAFKYTAYNWVIEILSFLALLWSLSPLFFWGKIDHDIPIPIHYNITGQADRWGDSSYLLVFSVLAILFYALFSILQKYPKGLNYPVKITVTNANNIYKLGISLVRHLKLILALIFAYLNSVTVAAAIGKGGEINNFVMLFLLGVLFLSLLYFSLKMRRYK